ncbi:MAG: hypothetical protein ACXWRU_18475 [Pseudobdellovibrionaceae bacterium]
MRSFFITILILSSGISQAAQYNCKLSDEANDPKVVEFTFDSTTTRSKFVTLGDGSSVGCIVFRAMTPLITCGRGSSETFTNFATSDEGVSILALDTNSNGTKFDLACIRHN